MNHSSLHLLGLLSLVSCATIKGPDDTDEPDPPEDHGTVIGNPGDLDMTVGSGEGAVARSATVTGAILTQVACDGLAAQSTMDDPLDLASASATLTWDSVCRIRLEFDGPLIIEGDGLDGGTFTAALDINQITVTSETGFTTDEQDFVLELGEPGWLDADQLGLATGTAIELNSSHPAHPLLVTSLTERSKVFADDGDGVISAAERAAGAAAASVSVDMPTRFIVAGDDFRRVTSTDAGESWDFDQDATGEEPLWSVGYGQTAQGDLYIAAGGNSEGIVMTSLDGEDWTQTTATDAALCGTAHSEASGFVIVGYEGHRLQSDDGVIWTDHPGDVSATYKSVAFGSDRYVAVGFSGARIKSLDGRDWLGADTTGLGTNDLNEVSYGDGLFVAVGNDGLISVTSDGETWIDKNDATATSMTGIAFGEGRFVAVGGGVSLVSDDAETWTEHALTPTLDKIAYGDGDFIAVGEEGAYRSSDGVDWTALSVAPTPRLRAIGFGPSL